MHLRIFQGLKVTLKNNEIKEGQVPIQKKSTGMRTGNGDFSGWNGGMNVNMNVNGM